MSRKIGHHKHGSVHVVSKADLTAINTGTALALNDMPDWTEPQTRFLTQIPTPKTPQQTSQQPTTKTRNLNKQATKAPSRAGPWKAKVKTGLTCAQPARGLPRRLDFKIRQENKKCPALVVFLAGVNRRQRPAAVNARPWKCQAC